MTKKCPVERVLQNIGKKWTLVILKELNDRESSRFNDLQKSLAPISPRMLSSRLKELEKKKIIKRKMYKEIPPRTEYELTEKGRELIGCFSYIDRWAEKYRI